MKDIHNHLIFGIDDGSKSIDESIKLLNEMSDRGVTEIVLTPHYIIGTNYNCNNKIKKEKLKELQKLTKIKLYLGNEVFIDNNILEYIENDEENFVIGGAMIYNLLMKYVKKMYVTEIDKEFDGDTFFPRINEEIWEEVSREKGPDDLNNNFKYEYVIYERKEN